MPSYREFAASQPGRFVQEQAKQYLPEMERLSMEGKPAIAAIDMVVGKAFPHLNDTERQHCGRIVRDVLAQHGWQTGEQKKIANHRLFRSGKHYVRREQPSPTAMAPATIKPGSPEALAAARALLAANRRDPLAPPDTVDAFLADRRANCGE